jgi:hypothetical protein
MIRTGFVRRGLNPDTAIEELNRTVLLGRIVWVGTVLNEVASDMIDEARS